MDGMKASAGKWLLFYGIHRGTLTSRDSGPPEEYGSKPEALREFAQIEQENANRGYSIWFAKLYDDQGRETVLGGSAP